jgi:hypothetical protein
VSNELNIGGIIKGDTSAGYVAIPGSMTVAGVGGLGVTYGISAGSVTATSFVGTLTGNADTVTTNANLTGPIVSVGNATTIVGPVPIATIDLSTVTTAIGLTVLKAGDTMTGPLTIAGSSLTVTGNSGITTYTLGFASATINTNYDVGFSSASEYWLALQSTTTLTFSGVGVRDEMVFYIEQSSNSKGITWPAYVDWGDAGTIILSTTTRKVDTVFMKCHSSAYCQGKGNKDGFTAP